ncbi:MAG: DEAD/DEAH box helicase family protein [Thermoguttaceae bacterium]|nr:DEAD/DEAH box helicase family protein [Thermoguttaceae bacterium]
MELRYYQAEAKKAVYRYLKENPRGAPCVVLPTGAGKTPLLASICYDVVVTRSRVKGKRQRVLVLSHVQELLEQARDKIKLYCSDLDVGVYSAGLGSRDVDSDVVVAGIQSVYKKADALGRFDVVIVDEAHMIPPDGDGRYRQFLRDAKIVNPDVRLVGLTATPYRMKSGELCGPENLLTDVCYEVNVKDLIEQGYLSPIKSRVVKAGVDASGLHIRAGEFIASEVENLVNTTERVKAACKEIVFKTNKYERRTALLFCASVQHAKNVKKEIERISGEECGLVLGDTPALERAETLARFKREPTGKNLLGETAKPLRYLANVGVLTTGFDNPRVDLVAILRPTASPGLYYQMIGRGLRKAEGKDYCLALDFGQNIDRHGPIDAIEVKRRKKTSSQSKDAPVKSCPKCELIVAASTRVCNDCGYEFPISETSALQSDSSDRSVVSGEIEDVTYAVASISYSTHIKYDENGQKKRSVKVTYRPQGGGRPVNEWICPEHRGYARTKFEDWWKKRSAVEPPKTVREVIQIANDSGLAPTYGVVVRQSGDRNGFARIVEYVLGQIPEPQTSYDSTVFGQCYRCVYCDDAQRQCVRHKNHYFYVDETTPVCEGFCAIDSFDDDIPF